MPKRKNKNKIPPPPPTRVSTTTEEEEEKDNDDEKDEDDEAQYHTEYSKNNLNVPMKTITPKPISNPDSSTLISTPPLVETDPEDPERNRNRDSNNNNPARKQKLYQKAIQSFKNYKMNLWTKICLGICSFIALILLIGLLAGSASYIEWYQFGFRRDNNAALVETDQIYYNGAYFWGPNYSPLLFNRTYYRVDFDNSSFTVFAQSGLEVCIKVLFQYQLIPSRLADMYAQYNLNFDSTVESLAKAKIKNTAPMFTVEDWYQNKINISNTFFAAIREYLLDTVFVNVTYFELQDVDLGTDVISKLLKDSTQQQLNEKEIYIQQSTLIRKETETLVSEYTANATRIIANACADAQFIIDSANADALNCELTQKAQGLADLFEMLGIDSSLLKLSFSYIDGINGKSDSTTEFVVNINQAQVDVQ